MSCLPFVRMSNPLPVNRKRRGSGRLSLGRLCRGGFSKTATDEPDSDGNEEGGMEDAELLKADEEGDHEADARSDEGDKAAPSDPVREARAVARATSEEEVPYRGTLEAVVPDLPAQAVWDELFEQEWGEGTLGIEDLLLTGASDVGMDDLVDLSDDTSTVHEREVTFTVPVPPAPFAPKFASAVSCFQAVGRRQPQWEIVLENTTQTPDVPFGGCFVVQSRTRLLWDEDGTTCSVEQSSRIVFLQRVGLLRHAIQSSFSSGQAKSGEAFLSALRSRARAPEEELEDVVEEASDSRCYFWEVQRRTAFFRRDWRAPCLPFDGDESWLRLDSADGKGDVLGQAVGRWPSPSSSKLLGGEDDWRLFARWKISYDSYDDGRADEAGWQYSRSFRMDGGRWSKSSVGRCCRRRLWVCDLEAEPPAE